MGFLGLEYFFNIYSLILLLTLLFLSYKWSVATYDYWDKKKVFSDKDVIPFFGSFKNILFKKKHLGFVIQDLYMKNKDKQFIGIYALKTPVFLPTDAKLVYAILVSDFSHFYDRGFHMDPNYDLIGNNLFFNNGELWKYQRNKLSPSFTSGKLRMIAKTVNESCDEFIDFLRPHSGQDIDTKEFMGEFFLSFIGKAVCGLEYYNIKNPDLKFKKMIYDINRNVIRNLIKLYLQFVSPYLNKKVKMTSQCIEDYFVELAKRSLKIKKEQRGSKQIDFLQLILEHYEQDQHKDKSELHFDWNSVVGNVAIFILAGEETSTQTMTMTFYYLVKNPDVLEKLVDEIRSTVKNIDEPLNYDHVMKQFPYLNMVIQEAMRLHSLVFLLQRVVTKEYTIPGSDITLDVGTTVYIPTLALHMDPEYWPEPEKFDPERFSEENIDKIVPGSYVPFGIGPRMCIGNRLALLDMKILFVNILSQFDVSATEKTPEKLTYSLGTQGIMLPNETIYLKFTEIK